MGEDRRSYAVTEADQSLWRAAEALRRVRKAIDRRDLDEARRIAAEAHAYASRVRVLDRLAALDQLSPLRHGARAEAGRYGPDSPDPSGRARAGQEDPGAQVS